MASHPVCPSFDLGQDPLVACADLPVGVLGIDAEGIVRFCNRLAGAIFAPLQANEFRLHSLLKLAGAVGSDQMMRTVALADPSVSARIDFPNGSSFDVRSQSWAGSGALITFSDVTSYIREAEITARDALTGLATRAVLHTRVEATLAENQRTGSSAAVLCINLDKFKIVNDTLGHAVGDELLVKVAERLRSVAKPEDLVARLGSDEFAILQVAGTQPQAAESLASRLIDLIGRTYIAAGQMVTVTASVGVAIAPSDGDDGPTLLKHADLALYRAKADGHGLARFFQSSMNVNMQARRLLELDLRKALALKEFEVFYQPQVDLCSNQLSGFEALIRWRSPSRGLVSPALFVPLAEEIGLISRIGEWVLQAACREAMSWGPTLSISVNVSPLQFRDGKLVSIVTGALNASGLPPERLELEITEGSLLDDTDLVLHTLRELKALGVRVSMDDFGTGYSSLSYLRKFPFDKIKVDQSFVRNLQNSPESAAIIRAVSALGHSLGIKTIAEGVETEEQLERVRAEGFGAVQGYLTGRPMPASQAALLTATPEHTGSEKEITA